MSEVMDQAERVLGEVQEVRDFVSELRGYINNIDSMLNDILPVHWDGGDSLDTAAMKSGIGDVVMTVNDFQYDVNQIESHTDRLLGAIEDLEGLEEEDEDE